MIADFCEFGNSLKLLAENTPNLALCREIADFRALAVCLPGRFAPFASMHEEPSLPKPFFPRGQPNRKKIGTILL